MPKKRRESTTDHKGPMRVVRSDRTKCGWCLSQDCEHCKPELTYYDRIYVCGCKCQDGYVPQAVRNGTVEVKSEKENEGENDVLRDMPISAEAGQEGSSGPSHGDELEGLSEGDNSLEREPVLGDNEPEE
jgi:hypothetical protein